MISYIRLLPLSLQSLTRASILLLLFVIAEAVCLLLKSFLRLPSLCTGEAGANLPWPVRWTLYLAFLAAQFSPLTKTLPKGHKPAVSALPNKFHHSARLVSLFQDPSSSWCGCLLSGLFHFPYVSPTPSLLSGP